MKQIALQVRSGQFDANPAKAICQLVGQVPPNTFLPDVSNIFERVLTVPLGSRLYEIESLRPYLEVALRERVDPFTNHVDAALLMQIRIVAAVDALLECCRDLPEQIRDSFLFRPLAIERVHELLVENNRIILSLADLESRKHAFPEWFYAAKKYAEVLDSCQRYMEFRSWCERLDTLAAIAGGKLTWRNSRFVKLFTKETTFATGKLAVLDGVISVVTDKFTEAFTGAPIDRIRRCIVCKRIFWADRKDMRGCSTKCSKIARTRKWRSKPDNREKERFRDYERYDEKRKERK